jgi:hypothetical protein
MSSEGLSGGQGVRFANLPIGGEFFLRGFKLKKVSSGTAKVLETPLGKEARKGTLSMIPDDHELQVASES